jgi:diguanylate cyclase (GGDEF)-like protein
MSSTHAVRKYLIGICLVINLIILSVFLGFYLRTDAMFHQQMIHTGRAFFEEIVVTRAWMATHQGIYVPIKPGDTVNPYLEDIPGLKVVIEDADGVSYMLKNPALATREISEIADRNAMFRFRITSLDPINPNNAPDAFERQSLLAFAKGSREENDYESSPSGRVFRYMAPLVMTAPCLSCHGYQGYKLGDVRGGISVTLPTQVIMKEMRNNRLYLALSVFGVIVIIALLIYFISRYFIRDLERVEKQMLEMAVTDHLTGLLNRREGFRRLSGEIARGERSGRPLCVMMIDIDHFKPINDTYGHLTGDRVLKKVALALKKTVRISDMVCRFGGEEFLVVLPETGSDDALGLAERLRSLIETVECLSDDHQTIHLTISVGVAERYVDESGERVIDRADQALYKAKNKGRNRVELSD